MRIAIDGTAPTVGGGVVWLKELVPALCAGSARDDFFLFLRLDMQDLNFRDCPNCRVQRVRLPKTFRLIWRLIWQQLFLPILLYKSKVDVIIAPFDLVPFLAPCKVVMGIQNVNPYFGPPAGTWLGRQRERLLRWLTKISAWRADKVFFVSEWSRRIISQKLGLPLNKSCVIYHGVSKRFQPREEFKLETSPYVLVVTSIRSHRDSLTLLRAWKRVVRSSNQPLNLHIVGPILEHSYYQQLILLAHDLQIDGSVVFMHEVSPDNMPSLYQGASALVMPSYAETFCLPLVEGMACGIPVIASDIPVAREICEEAACYYQLGDPQDLADKLISVLKNSKMRVELIKAGKERASRFSWDKAAFQMLELLKGLV